MTDDVFAHVCACVFLILYENLPKTTGEMLMQLSELNVHLQIINIRQDKNESNPVSLQILS